MQDATRALGTSGGGASFDSVPRKQLSADGRKKRKKSDLNVTPFPLSLPERRRPGSVPRGRLLLISGGSWHKPPLLQMMPLLVPNVLFCVVF